MGTASFSVTTATSYGGSAMMNSVVRTSGTDTTNASTAENLEDASGDITMSVGEIIEIHADEAMRVRFGGTAATASTGHYIPAGEQRIYHCNEAGKVSIIDVA